MRGAEQIACSQLALDASGAHTDDTRMMSGRLIVWTRQVHDAIKVFEKKVSPVSAKGSPDVVIDASAAAADKSYGKACSVGMAGGKYIGNNYVDPSFAKDNPKIFRMKVRSQGAPPIMHTHPACFSSSQVLVHCPITHACIGHHAAWVGPHPRRPCRTVYFSALPFSRFSRVFLAFFSHVHLSRLMPTGRVLQQHRPLALVRDAVLLEQPGDIALRLPSHQSRPCGA
jgi:hypothetical protein